MRILMTFLGGAMIACGASQTPTEKTSYDRNVDKFDSASTASSDQALLATAQLRVSRATLGTLASEAGPSRACGGEVLFAEQGAITVTIADTDPAAWRVRPGEALFIPSRVSWSAVSVHGDGSKRSTALYARVSAAAVECPRASDVIAYTIPANGPVWHDNAEGKLMVRMLLGGRDEERLPMSLAELRGEAGFSVPPHVHEHSDENLWISSGSGTMHVGDEVIEVHSDQWIHVPKGALHSFESDGSEPLVALQMYVPSGPEQRFIQ